MKIRNSTIIKIINNNNGRTLDMKKYKNEKK